MSKRLGEKKGEKVGFQKSLGRWGGRERVLSGDYFMSNCIALFQRRKLVDMAFQEGLVWRHIGKNPGCHTKGRLTKFQRV